VQALLHVRPFPTLKGSEAEDAIVVVTLLPWPDAGTEDGRSLRHVEPSGVPSDEAEDLRFAGSGEA
jgi:hypothetical protein